MKKKILIVIYIILLFIIIKLFYNHITNSILINKYNKGQYSENVAKSLTYVNFPQSYVANYNYGNILYQKGEYEKAIEEYENALKVSVPKDKECSVRTNYALAICQTIQLNEKEQESINTAIKIYESAIDILTENGCANKENNNGHNQNAEQLKKDIQKEIDRLKRLQKNKNSDTEEKNTKNEEEKTNEKTKTIEKEIQKIKEDATKEQREMEETYKEFNKKIEPRSKNW